MKTIVAGSRDVEDYGLLVEAIESAPFEVTHLIHGGARGVDTMAKRWAEEQGLPVTEFKADWNRFGKGAGPIRNKEMARNAEALIAIWDGTSKRNSKHDKTRRRMRTYGLRSKQSSVIATI